MKIDGYKLWTALVTPMTPGLKVDYPSLKKLILEQVEAKNGLLILGSTGEALNLSLEDKKNIVEFVSELNTVSPIMIGIGGHDLSAQKAWLAWLETKDVDAYLMVTPLYSKPNDNGQYLWFKDLMDLSTKPVMLYNVPGRTGTSLSIDAVKKLISHPRFWAIKEASGSVSEFTKYLQASGRGKVFCGDDALMPEFAKAGSYGLVSVASNVWPKQTHLYVAQCLDLEAEHENLDAWKSPSESLFVVSNPIPTKVLLAHQKRITSSTLMPPLSDTDMKNVTRLLVEDKNINDWFKNN